MYYTIVCMKAALAERFAQCKYTHTHTHLIFTWGAFPIGHRENFKCTYTVMFISQRSANAMLFGLRGRIFGQFSVVIDECLR